MAVELNLASFMNILNNYGISTLFGPFLVVFTMIYGLLHKIGLFKNQERIIVAISFVFSLYYIASINAILFSQRFFAMFFYEILTILLILIAFSIFARGPTGDENVRRRRQAILSGILGLTVVIAALYAFKGSPEQVGSVSQGILEMLYKYIIETGLFTLLVMVGAFIILTKWLTSAPKKEEEKKGLKERAKEYVKIPADLLEELIHREKKE